MQTEDQSVNSPCPTCGRCRREFGFKAAAWRSIANHFNFRQYFSVKHMVARKLEEIEKRIVRLEEEVKVTGVRTEAIGFRLFSDFDGTVTKKEKSNA